MFGCKRLSLQSKGVIIGAKSCFQEAVFANVAFNIEEVFEGAVKEVSK